MASEEARDWRTGLSLQERQRFMYEGRYASDVTLDVGKVNPKKIAAHGFVLVCGSPVFEAMLTAGREGDIVVEDVEPEVFDAVLKFLYCEQIELKVDTAFDVLHAARKYEVSQLVVKCTAYLMSIIDVHNVCLYLNKSVQYDEKELFEGYMNFISCNTNKVLDSTEFTRISHQCLKKVLESDLTSSFSPRGVYTACLRWADAQCNAEAKALTDENRRVVLGSCLYLIRFTYMSITEFTKVTQETKFLADDERLQILEYIANCELGSEYKGPMVFAKCKPGNQYKISRYTDYNDETWNFPKTSAIDFKCSRRVWITGVGLYTCYEKDTEVVVKLMEDECEVLADTGKVVIKYRSPYDKLFSCHTTDVLSLALSDTGSVAMQRYQKFTAVDFPVSVRVRRNHFYRISAEYKRKQFRYGTKGQKTVENGGVAFTFRDTPGNATTVKQGQIPAIFFAA